MKHFRNTLIMSALSGVLVGMCVGGGILGMAHAGATQTQDVTPYHALTYYYDPGTGCHYVSNGSSQSGIVPRMEPDESINNRSHHLCRPPKR